MRAKAIWVGALVVTASWLAAVYDGQGPSPTAFTPVDLEETSSTRVEEGAPLPSFDSFEAVQEEATAFVSKVQPECRFKLRIFSSVGRFLSGARVLLADGDGSAVRTLVSDEEGLAETPHLCGRYTAIFQANGHRSLTQTITADRGGRETSVLLQKELVLRGVVVNELRKEVSDAAIRLNGASVARTKSRGRFSLQANRGDILSAEHPQYGQVKVKIQDRHLSAAWIALRLIPESALFEQASTIEGVVESDGFPVSGATVTAFPSKGWRYVVLSDDNGRFSVPSPGAGPFRVEAAGPEGRTKSLEGVSPGAKGLRIELDMGATLEGFVVDDAGAPVRIYRLRYGLVGGAPIHRTILDPNGHFSIFPVDPGLYLVDVETDSGGAVDRVEVPSLGVGSVDLVLSRPGSITGRVLDADTQDPIPQAKVTLESQVGFRGQVKATGDESGWFRLDKVPSGRRSISASGPGYRRRIVGALDVAGEDLGPIEIRLTPSETDEGLDLVGIGAVMRTEGGRLEVQDIIAGGGAAQAGLVPGTTITAVDGVSIEKLGFDGAIQAIRGKEGTTVQLTVEMEGKVLVKALLRTPVSI